jgi:hypothetical protein
MFPEGGLSGRRPTSRRPRRTLLFSCRYRVMNEIVPETGRGESTNEKSHSSGGAFLDGNRGDEGQRGRASIQGRFLCGITDYMWLTSPEDVATATGKATMEFESDGNVDSRPAACLSIWPTTRGRSARRHVYLS